MADKVLIIFLADLLNSRKGDDLYMILSLIFLVELEGTDRREEEEEEE